MKLTIDDIPEGGLSIVATSTQDDWLNKLFKGALGDRVGGGDGLKLDLNVSLIGNQVECLGGLYYSIHPTCSRCGAVFALHDNIPLHFHYISASDTKGRTQNREEQIDMAEDENFSIYEGRSIDLDPMLYEQLVLAQPTVYLCKQDCKGLCPKCGSNLNLQPCQCLPGPKTTPFEALKGFKVSK